MPKKNRKKSNAGKAMDKAKQAMSSVTKPETKTIAAPAVSEKKEVAVTNAVPAPAKTEVKKEEPKPAPKSEMKAEIKSEPKKEEPKKEAPVAAKPAEKLAAKAMVKEAPAKKPAEKTAAAKKPTTAKKPVNKKKAPARKTAAAAPTYETFIEFEGAQINVTPETINAKVLEAYKADGHRPGNIKSLQVYMNLNERRAYYVINGKEEGKFVEF